MHVIGPSGIIPVCVQGSVAAFCSDVSSRIGRSAVGGACLHFLHLQPMKVHLNSRTSWKKSGVALCSASWNNNSRCYILCVFLHLLLTLSECGLLPVCFILCSFKCVNVCQLASCSCWICKLLCLWACMSVALYFLFYVPCACVLLLEYSCVIHCVCVSWHVYYMHVWFKECACHTLYASLLLITYYVGVITLFMWYLAIFCLI